MTFWDKIAPLYDIAESLNSRVYIKMLGCSKALTPNGAKVLECAAGTGAISIAVAEKATHVTCTDMSLPMLERARKKCAERRIKNVSFEHRDIFRLTDADETYDVVIAANVLHLVENPQNAVSELMRVLKHGGRLLLPTFVTSKGDGSDMGAVRLYKLLGFAPKESYSPKKYFEMLQSCHADGKLKMRVISGFIPNAYAVIEKN